MWMPEDVTDEGVLALAAVEPLHSPQFFFSLSQCARLTLYMLVEQIDGPLDHEIE